MKEFDFLILGTGIAGLSAALKAARHGSVGLVTKRAAAETSTAWAQGGIACVTSPEDSFELHVADTLEAGAGLCREEVVRAIVAQAPERIRDLIGWGVEFDQRKGANAGEFDLTREGGHSKRRILHTRDTTGREIESSLLQRMREEPRITLFENHFAIDCITTGKLGLPSDNRAVGVYVLDCAAGQVETFRSDRIALCTGGCGKVYQYSTNPDVATGDGVAMAWRAGAAIANMEFIQFHPTCLYHPQAKSFLISEALRGEGGILIGQDGLPFMERYDSRGSLAPRDVVARAIDSELKRTGSRCVFVDASSKSREFFESRFPHIYETCLRCGIDPTREPIPVVPAAHYQCGGVQTGLDAESTLRGLYAVGEVACTGLHGANRLASNSLLEGAVMAHRAVEHMIGRYPINAPPRLSAEIPRWKAGDAQDLDELVVIYHNWDEIRHLMWDYVSIVRTGKRLLRAATRLRNLKREVQEFYWNFRITGDLLELRNLVDTAALIVESAVLRRESRGLHYTLDHPQLAPGPARDTVLTRF